MNSALFGTKILDASALLPVCPQRPCSSSSNGRRRERKIRIKVELHVVEGADETMETDCT